MESPKLTSFAALNLITSTSRQPERLNLVHPIKHPTRFAEVVAGIACTKKTLILSGDAALAGTGIEPSDSPIPSATESRRTSYWNLIVEATTSPEKLSPERLAIYNQVMVDRRISARRAGRNVFLDFLDRLGKDDRLARCLTTSIDGLEARLSPELEHKVKALYGDNRFVRCLDALCEGLEEEPTTRLDGSFRSLQRIICRPCHSRNIKNNKSRRSGNEETRTLRPSVQRRIGLSFMHVEIPQDDNGDQGDDYVDESESVVAGLKSKGSAHSQGKGPTGRKGKGAPGPKGQFEVTAGGKSQHRPRRKRDAPTQFAPPDPVILAGYDEGSSLFLILGAPPKDPDLLNVIRDLALSVHGRGGAVVYIDPAPLHGSSQHDHIDIHLQADIQETLGEVIRQMQRRPAYEAQGEETIDNDAELWFDLVENELSIRHTEKEVAYDGAICAHCGCGIPDYLVPCTQCSLNFCYRRMTEEDSESASEPDEPSASKPSVEPEDGVLRESRKPDEGATDTDKSFAFHEACIAFNAFCDSGITPSLGEVTESFVCPWCWNHQEKGLYPHFVRPVARESVELYAAEFPRLAMVIYYVEQFWPQTKHLVNLMTGFWRQLGWEFRVEPVKLQRLQEKQDAFVNLQWEPGTYQFIAVYLTHGLAGEQGYQLNNFQALRPAELLSQTLPIVQTGLNGASSSLVFFFSCGHPLHHPGLVMEVCDWVSKEENPGIVIGCLNKKLSPVYMFIVFAKITKALAEQPQDMCKTIQLNWLRDSIACGHSDLLCIARNRPAEMWLYAPFQSRPLGKPLPSLLSVCSCTASSVDPAAIVKDKRHRKIWKVQHNGKPGAQLRDVEVTAICRACRQKWVLPQETLAGMLIRVNGVYGAVVPYFAS